VRFPETFVQRCEAFIKMTRLFENIFREIEVLLNLYKAFIKITRLFEEIYRGWRLLLRIARFV
jgi:hypothetical protein